jgi:hypothetical protein
MRPLIQTETDLPRPLRRMAGAFSPPVLLRRGTNQRVVFVIQSTPALSECRLIPGACWQFSVGPPAACLFVPPGAEEATAHPDGDAHAERGSVQAQAPPKAVIGAAMARLSSPPADHNLRPGDLPLLTG